MKCRTLSTTLLAMMLFPAVLMAQSATGHKSLFDQLQERVDTATGQLAIVGSTLETVGDRLPRLETRPSVVTALEARPASEVEAPTPGRLKSRIVNNTAKLKDTAVAERSASRRGKTPLGTLKEREEAKDRDSNMGMFTMATFLVGIVVLALWLKRRRRQVPLGRKTATIETIAAEQSSVFGNLQFRHDNC